jgi:anaerobic selenocysteine-containing dehydrogenase
MLRAGPYGDQFGAEPDGLSLDKLEANPHGIDLGPLTPQIPDALKTTTGKVELVPQPVVDDIPRLAATLGAHRNGSLVLVGRRHVRSNNSWMHNVASLVTGRDRCTLLIHPEDAARAGVADGAPARVRSKAGELVAPVEVSDEMMPGVVCLPHGWGHDKTGAKLSVAAAHAGVCNNVLAPGELVDVPSGNAVVNGIPVEVLPLG